MSGVNKAILIGRLGQDPQIKTFENGGKIANFSMATSESWKDKQTGEKKEVTDWHNISVRGPLVDVIQRYVHKGDMLYVEGKMRTRSWEKDGVTRYLTEVIADNFTMLGGKRQEGQAQGGYTPTPAPAAASHVSDGPSDDLPF